MATRVVCEICGEVSGIRWYRSGDATVAAEHDTNRTLMDAYFADRAGLPGVAGRRACRVCSDALYDAAQ